ncbi:MAG: ROK family protein [Candidatus Omnitrophica bacterium]|nr:ROK family protein [Candidatus Omnitrophota bacterium]
MNKYYIGIDVGGTNIKFGLLNESGTIIARNRLSTVSCASSKKKLINALTGIIHQLMNENNLKNNQMAGIGFGLPGLIDAEAGEVKILTNIFGWKNVPLKKMMEDATGIPTFIDNDVNVITLGEWKYGAGRGYDNLVCITVGTGVGGGLILNGEIYRGPGFTAGEIGHIPLNEKGPACNCGGSGCLEAYVGNRHLIAKAAKLFKNKNIRLEDVSELAKKENSRAIEFWEEAGFHIGMGLVSVINVLNPQLIVIGGGVSNGLPFMKKSLEKTIQSRAMKIPAGMVKIVKAKLGDDAGLIGAMVLVKSQKVRSQKSEEKTIG